MKRVNLKFVTLLYLAAMVALHAIFFWTLRHEVRRGYSDFAIFYSAGRIVGQGRGHDLYDGELQFRTQQEFAPDVRIRQGALPYNHPPFEALIFVPFAWLKYFPAYLLWDSISLMILISLPLLLRPHVALLRLLPAPSCVLATLAFFPVFVALLQGQDIVVLLLLLSLTYVSLKKNAESAAGCWLGLGLFRFHLVLPLAVMLCLKKRKAAMGFAVVAMLLGLISIAVVGWRTTLAYPGYVLHLEVMGGNGSIVPADMPNLRGLLDTLPHLHHLRVILTVASSLIMFVLAFAKWKPDATESTFDLGFALVIVVTVLVSYHALAYDLTLLLLPILLVVNRLKTTWPVRKPVALLAPIMVLSFSPMLMFLTLRARQTNLLALVLLLWAWGVWREIQRIERFPGSAT